MTASPVAWTDVQQALYTWFATSTGLATSWAFQKRPQDNIASGFGTLTVLSVELPPSLEEDETRTRETAGELYADQVGTRYLTINCQVASAVQSFEGHAQNLLSRAQAALTLTEFNNSLGAAGVTFVRNGAITNISAIAGAGFESRASMDVVFSVQSLSIPEQTDGYFTHTILTNLDTGNTKQIGPAP